MKALLVILMFLMFASSLGGRNSQLDFLRKSKQIFNEFADKAPVLLQEIGELFFDPDIYTNITICSSKIFDIQDPESYGGKIDSNDDKYSYFVKSIEANFQCM